jgi:hypothetical protein
MPLAGWIVNWQQKTKTRGSRTCYNETKGQETFVLFANAHDPMWLRQVGEPRLGNVRTQQDWQRSHSSNFLTNMCEQSDDHRLSATVLSAF